MALLVSLDRGTSEVELGAHDVLMATGEELYRVNGDKKLLARHRHNRWMMGDEAEPYVRLNIVGPLVVVGPGPAAKQLGPYQKFSTFDGVAYVENRVFGFWDTALRDWYIVDAAAHWAELRIRFHPTS